MRTAVLFSSALLLLVVFTSEVFACSQCVCGTPISFDAFGEAVPMRFRYGIEERYLSKSNGLDEGPGEERAKEHRVSAFALWRATNNIALLGRLPYNRKSMTTAPTGEDETTETSRGLGDAELVGVIRLVHRAHAPALDVVVGIAAPTGSNDAHGEDGERLDVHMQPGSGAWSGTTGLSTSYVVSIGTLDASLLGRSGSESSHGYRYGNALLFNAGFTSHARNGWQLLAGINGRSAKRDRFEDATLGENTGGTVAYAAPGFRWTSSIGLGVDAVAQIPFAQSLHGDQTERTTARVALTFGN